MKFAELLSTRRSKICLTDTSVNLSAKVNRFSVMKELERPMRLCDHLMCFEKIKSKKMLEESLSEEYSDEILSPAPKNIK